MRIRVLLAGLAVVFLALFGWAGAASAAQEEEGVEPADHEAEECLHILEGGGEVDECQEAPSPIVPATDELIWGAISFALLTFALIKFAWPPLKKSMEDRTERIRDSIDSAERAKDDANQVLEQYRAQLADARNESARIIEEARQTADQLRRDLQQRAEADIAEMRTRAQEEINAAKDRAMAEVRTQVSELAINAAELVVGRSLDRETNRQLVDQFIDQVGSTR
ncbi:MAG: F0F1 ATP synthase subunit B [Actinomycetota bacterium]